MATVLPVSNETKNTTTRVTKEGRQLTYEMEVIQQPERARACGSGAKSSADRRPVDPPPVVQLRIFEGEAKTDITFSYNANFFLYTTLESARPIAQGRVPQVPTPFPVLTGMPVAGMAYLDRPDPAGYFIFPDLSVRHEGKYRLSFNLFEELKESKDADSETATPSPNIEDRKLSQMNPMSPRDHVHFRLEVKSVPFNVFSAKKFPGLAESTQLSRVVAEQGCRVRIRRDVRMRRRDTKATQGYEEFDEENAYARSDRYVTPDMYVKTQMPDRPRSTSHGSVDVPTPYTVEPRRMSAQDMNYFSQSNFQQAPPVQPAQAANPNYTSHLSFGVSNSNQYAAPSFQPPPAPVPQQLAFTQNGSAFQYPGSHTRQMSMPRNNYGIQQPQATQQSQYQQSQPFVDGKDYRPLNDYRRTSNPTSTPIFPSQQINSYPQAETRPPMQQTWYPQPAPAPAAAPAPRAPTPVNGAVLPPLKTLQPPLERKLEPGLPVSAVPAPSPASSTPSFDNLQNKFTPYATTPQSAPSHLGKRPFGSVFDSTHLNQPMHGGMRPSTQGQDIPQVDTDEALEGDYDQDFRKLLSYKRADGTQQLKKCPSPISE